MKRILVTGSNGQLGLELKERIALLPSSVEVIFTDIEELDITDEQAVVAFVKSKGVDCVINCAAYTAVDKAETEEKSAEKINRDAVHNLVQACSLNNAFLIHVSTDYVFDGKNYKPYTEFDLVNPVSAYGRTKLAGEQVMKGIEKGIVIRTSWLYSNFGHNFVFTMQRLGASKETVNVVSDQIGTPTYAGHLAEAIWKIIPQLDNWNEGLQIYHFSNEGACSWYDFASEIMEQSKLNCKVLPIESKDYPTAAERPFYSVLNKAKIKQRFNINIEHWKKGLKDMLSKQK